ncbi:hypothetical protein [Nocardioides gilvus]|uniref:hypothetical protein n=1 Tax=Nocardioides gilvus TaxID=1735589 RepID=UPI000D74EE16|nr:hypothetical protein [Nocardioides gilvus]
MRTHARTRGRLVGAAAVALGLLVVPVSSWADTGGEVSVDNIRPQLGDEITVTGSGFTEGDQVSFRVCGAPDATGRLACVEGNESLEVAFDGTVRGPLTVEEPPGDCPCSVVVVSPGAPPAATPINLVGHPMAKAVQAPDLVVDAATLEPSGGLGRWLGAAPDVTLRMTLRNAGVAPAEPTLDLVWRDGDDAPQPITDSGLPIVEPGESVEVEVPLKFGSFAQGEHSVSGQVVVGDLYAPVEASTTLAPWGLYALVLGGLGAAGYARIRKIGGSETPVGPATPRNAERKVDRRAPGRRVSVPAAREATRESVRDPVREPERVARTESPEPASPRRDDSSTPAYVGPPRLESTPLAPRPGAARLMTLESQNADAAVEAPRVPQQGSAFPRQETVAPSRPAVTRSTTPEQDAATVANAMAIIRERAGSAPAQLPANYEVAPSGKRAERGGKRAARPEKPQRFITRR